jgi:hypothetical protein
VTDPDHPLALRAMCAPSLYNIPAVPIRAIALPSLSCPVYCPRSAPPLMPQVAFLLVTHRLAAACPISDSIVALELGRVSAIGTHEEHLGCHPGGVYETLWTGQLLGKEALLGG